MNKKGIIAALLAVLTGTTPVFAANSVSDVKTSSVYNWNHNYYTETVEYTCIGSVEEYVFEPEITLQNRKYELLSSDTEVVTVEEPDIQPDKKTVTFTGLTSAELEGIEKSLQESGVSYELSEQDVTIQEQTEQLSSYQMSGLVYAEPDINSIPATDSIEYDSPITQETTVQELPFKNMELSTPYAWRDGFELNFTLEVYEAEYFLIGNERVYLDKEAPVLPERSKAIIIEAAGLPVESFTIETMEWTSDIYEEHGVNCRDAIVRGKQLLGEYRINYESDNCKTGKLYDVTATYTVTDEDFQEQVEEASIYYCKSEARYKAASPVTLWQIILLLIIILVTLLLFIFIMLPKRKKRKKQKEEEESVHGEQSIVVRKAKPESFTNRDGK